VATRNPQGSRVQRTSTIKEPQLKRRGVSWPPFKIIKSRHLFFHSCSNESCPKFNKVAMYFVMALELVTFLKKCNEKMHQIKKRKCTNLENSTWEVVTMMKMEESSRRSFVSPKNNKFFEKKNSNIIALST